MPLPPAPTKRASTLQAQIKVSTDKTFKSADKKVTSVKETELFSSVPVKNKSFTEDSATDFSLKNHQKLNLNQMVENSAA